MGDGDKKLVVGVEIAYDNQATSAPADLNRIEASASRAAKAMGDAAADFVRFNEAQAKAQDKLSAPTRESELFQELMKIREGAKAAASQADETTIKVGQLKDILTAVKQAQAGSFDGAAISAGKLLGNLGPLATNLGLVGAALATGVKLGSAFGDALADLITDTSALTKLTEEVNDSIRKMGQSEIDVSGISKGIDDIIGQYDRLLEKAQQVSTSQKSMRDAAAGLEEAKLDRDESRAKAAATSPEQERAIAAEYARKRYDLKAATEIAEIDKRIEELSQQAFLKQQALNKAQDKILEARERLAEAEAKYRDEVAARMAAGATRAEAIGRSGNALREVEAAGNTARQVESSNAGKIDALVAALDRLQDASRTEGMKRETAVTKADQKAFELGAESAGVIRDLTAAIRAQEQKVTAARASGSNTELQTALAELERLRGLSKSAAETVKVVGADMGQAYQDGATAMKTKAEAAKKEITTAGEQINTTTDKVRTDVTAAAGKVAAAADGATGQMSGAIEKLGAQVTQSVGQIAARVESSMTSISQRMSAMESRLAAAEQTANNASQNAATALSQNRSR